MNFYFTRTIIYIDKKIFLNFPAVFEYFCRIRGNKSRIKIAIILKIKIFWGVFINLNQKFFRVCTIYCLKKQ